MLDVKLNVLPVTTSVTVSAPSVNVPLATGSTLSSVVPAGHETFPDSCVGSTCVAPAVPPGSTHARQAAPTTMLTMPAIPRRRRLTSSPMGLCSLVPGPLCPAIPLHLTYGHTPRQCAVTLELRPSASRLLSSLQDH